MKVEAFGIFLVLLPGLLSAYVVQALAVRRKQSDIDKAVEALLLSFILYLVTVPFFSYALPVSWHEIIPNSNEYEIKVRWGYLCVLTFASVLLGILYSANINRDWMLRLLRRIGVTERTARSTIWNDVFQQIGGWVQIGLAGDVVIVGWLAYYSDEAEESSLFLEDAAWIDKNGDENPIDGPGILITKEVGIEYVVFLRSRDEAIEEASAKPSPPESLESE